LVELSRACDCGVDGLIGADFFRKRVVQIDFKSSQVRLLSSYHASSNASTVELKSNRGAMLAAVSVDDGELQWLRVDTGCSSPLQWVVSERQAMARNGNLSVALTELNIPTTATSVRLGRSTFHSVPTGLHQQPIFSGESGLLGNGLLARFERVTFD